MKSLGNVFKGVLIGAGAILPGISSGVLCVILGIYEKILNSVLNFFSDVKGNFKYLFPFIVGIGIGVIIFSKIVNYFLNNFEMYTRFAFLGLVIGTIPLFYKEVKKEGFNKKYYILIIAAAICGFSLFFVNKDFFPQVTNPNLFQSVILGVAVAGSSIVPGVDSAVILSSLGLYELYVSSLASLNFSILIPAGVGLVVGALVISFIINKLIKRFYTATFSIIFGLFLSIIPNVLNESCKIGFNAQSVIAIIIAIIGFGISYFLGDIKGNIEKSKKLLTKLKILSNKTETLEEK